VAKYRPLPVSEHDLVRIPDAVLGSAFKAYIEAQNAHSWPSFNQIGQLSTIRKILDEFLEYVEAVREPDPERVRAPRAARRRT
jgi:hypothetical protein